MFHHPGQVVLAGVERAACKQRSVSCQHQQHSEFDRCCAAEYNFR
jgi:hypothetical protein